MFDLPQSTIVRRRIPKEAFYRRVPMSTAVKKKFVSDLEKIYVEHSLTKESLNLTEDSEINEILILSLVLKKQNYDPRILEVIARQNPHKLVFWMQYQNQHQLAIYIGKLYRTPWIESDKNTFRAAGTSMDDLWFGFIEQIALYDERTQDIAGLSLKQRLALHDKIVKLEKDIEQTEKSTWKEKQPKKRFTLYTRLQEEKQKLEELING